MKSVKEFMNSNPSVKEVLVFQINQIEEDWLPNSKIRLKSVLEEIEDNIDEDRNVIDEIMFDKQEFRRAWEMSRIETLESMITSLKYKLRQLND